MSEVQVFSSAQSEALVSQSQYAGFWWRYLAYFIDAIIIQIGSVVIFIVPVAVMSIVLIAAGVPKDSLQVISNLSGLVVGWTISWLYYAWLESSEKQATFGKRICRLKVVNKEGERLSFGTASARIWARIGHAFVLTLLGLILGGVLGYFVLGGGSIPTTARSFDGLASGWVSFFGIILGAFFGVLLGSIAGYLPALWTSKKQALHDLIAGTVVVKSQD